MKDKGVILNHIQFFYVFQTIKIIFSRNRPYREHLYQASNPKGSSFLQNYRHYGCDDDHDMMVQLQRE